MTVENNVSIAERLDQILADGPAKDIFRAEEALGITNAIAAEVEAVNASDFQPILVAVQSYSIEQFILAINKLFDRPNRRYQLRSLPAIVEFVLGNVEHLPPQQPWHEPALEWFGVSLDELKAHDGANSTAVVMRSVRGTIPTPESNEALNALKALRDKRLAHPEQVEVEQLPKATWEEAEALLSLAKGMTGVLSACTNSGYVDDDGDYLLSYDSEVTIINLRRMLKRIGIKSG